MVWKESKKIYSLAVAKCIGLICIFAKRSDTKRNGLTRETLYVHWRLIACEGVRIAAGLLTAKYAPKRGMLLVARFCLSLTFALIGSIPIPSALFIDVASKLFRTRVRLPPAPQ